MLKNLFLCLILMISVSSVSARSFIINSISNLPDYEASFLLTNSKTTDYYLTLDCQSYFNKLDGFDAAGKLITEHFISTGECYYLWENVKNCIQTAGSKCINTEDLFNPDCSCH